MLRQKTSTHVRTVRNVHVKLFTSRLLRRPRMQHKDNTDHKHMHAHTYIQRAPRRSPKPRSEQPTTQKNYSSPSHPVVLVRRDCFATATPAAAAAFAFAFTFSFTSAILVTPAVLPPPFSGAFSFPEDDDDARSPALERLLPCRCA